MYNIVSLCVVYWCCVLFNDVMLFTGVVCCLLVLCVFTVVVLFTGIVCCLLVLCVV